MNIKRTGTYKKEYNRLKRILKDIDADSITLLENTIDLIAFDIDQMEKQMQMIYEEGAVVLFKNGKQEFHKKHPAFEAYNKLQTNYRHNMKQLMDAINKLDDDDAGNKAATINSLGSLRDRKLKAVK